MSGANICEFVQYPAAPCRGNDTAAMVLRTDQSMLVLCRTSGDSLYYKGVRFGHQAGIELGDVTSNPGGYTAVNSSDGTRYEVTLPRLTIVVNGQDAASDPQLKARSSQKIGWVHTGQLAATSWFVGQRPTEHAYHPTQ